MKNKNLLTLIVLIALSLLVAILSLYEMPKAILFLIFALKFILVSFNFMEMKHAHAFWKVTIILFCLVLFTTIYIFK